MQRLKATVASAKPPTRATDHYVDVAQGLSNMAQPVLLGNTAVIVPTPRGSAVKPNPVNLTTLDRVWGWRRDRWRIFDPGYFGTSDANASWFQSVAVTHPAKTMGVITAAAALHFHFDGRVFEVLVGGNDLKVTLVADGKLMSPRYMTTTFASNGVPGVPLLQYNTYVAFDFGSAAPRSISLYCRSTYGPTAMAIGPNDSLTAWDRSSEPSVCFMTDSYGSAHSTNWGESGPFGEAAAQLGLPHVDMNIVGGTGYGPQNTNADTRDPGNAFPARLADSAALQPDLFFTAGGINDNNGGAAPPLYASDAEARAGFLNAVQTYYQQLRAALPNAVLVAMGPWQPQQDYIPSAARDKCDVIKQYLSAVGGPWIFLDNVRGGWSNSAGASAAGSGPWQTGNGNEGAPRNDGGNGDLYVSADGTHPNEAGCNYLGGLIADNLRAALLAL